MRMMGVRFEEPDRSWTPVRVMGEFTGPFGLYVHVPFCGVLCPFCPYNKVVFDRERAGTYLAELRSESELYGVIGGPTFSSLYVGGGTPTLCLDGLGWLADVDVAGERAIEVLPTHMNARTAARLEDLGFDAVSIGAQSFDDSVLTRLHRPTTAADNRRAVALARTRFRIVDVDLIFDVGYDDPQTLLDDLAEAFSHDVDQVSTYPLMRFGYTPFGKAEHDRRAEHRLLRRATALAAEHGYERAAVWTFRRLDGATYTSITRPYYLGLGAGAATFTGRSFAVNHFGLVQYAEALGRGRLPTARVASLPRPAAALYRAFWQTYTGTPSPAEAGDPLLDHSLVRSIRYAAHALRWTSGAGDAQRLTPVGYDRYHDLERWVTYHLIEPLWAELMAEHSASPAPRGASARIAS